MWPNISLHLQNENCFSYTFTTEEVSIFAFYVKDMLYHYNHIVLESPNN